MRLQPIIYTRSMDDTVDWYSKVLDTEPAYRSDMWTSFAVGGATLGIHRVDGDVSGSKMELSLVAEDPLEEVEAKLGAHGVPTERGIQEETFGRSLVLKDPGGSLIQVNEHHHG